MTIGRGIAIVGVAAVGCITGVVMSSQEVAAGGLLAAAFIAFWG